MAENSEKNKEKIQEVNEKINKIFAFKFSYNNQMS